MATPTVSAVYIHVVEDVLSKVRDEFLTSGVGDNVLNELQGLWEMKMIQCGAITGPIDRSSTAKNAAPITPVHDLNVPYEGPEEYETPKAEMLFPPTPLQTPIQTPLPGNIEQALYQLPTPNGPTDYASLQDTHDLKPGRPSPRPPSPWMNQRNLGVDVNVAYEEGREEGDRGASNQPLTQLWEMKMIQCGAITGPIDRSSTAKNAAPITPVHDLNVPYEGPEEYETPTAEMLFPPTPLQTPIQTPLPGNIEQALYQLPTPNGPTDYASLQDTHDLKPGRPSPYMRPPSPWMNQRNLGVDVNVAYEEGREEGDRGASNQPLTQDFFTGSSSKRKRDDYAQRYNHSGYIPQQDGSSDSKSMVCHNKDSGAFPSIPQQDGVHDSYDDLFHLPGSNDEYGTPAGHDTSANQIVSTPKPSKNEANEDDEPPLNEDDDDDDDLDDLDQGDEEPDTHHLVLAQFDKVTRTKSKWKCTLKDGIMHINSKDILFNKANGDFDF